MTFGDFPILKKISNRINPPLESPPTLDLPPHTDIQPLIETGYLLNPLQINDPIEDNILELDPYPIYEPPIYEPPIYEPPIYEPPIYEPSFKNWSSWMKENVIPVCSAALITTCLFSAIIINNAIEDAIDTPGAKGDQGIVGIQGDSGLNGKNGLQGAEGIAGLDGEQGETGIAGLNGIQGEVGAIGLTGAAGLNGAKGDAGVAGLNGVNGSPGANGSTGATGNNGTNGSNGADGASAIFLKTKTTDTDLVREGGAVIQLSLPAGTYLLVWTGLAIAKDVNGQEFVNCGIQDATTGFARGAMLTDLQGVIQRAYISQQASLTLNAAGTASVFCNTRFRDGSAVIAHQTFSAQKVSTVTIQP